jgi:arabinose-5-phosphate isomerase
MQNHQKYCELGLAVINTELEAIIALRGRIDQNFAQACEHLLACEGRIVVLGMGKSGHIANKIAATLASTGSPAFFVHPGEAGHGDLGMITKKDVVIALSNSGETTEILTILPLIKRMNIPLIAMTGNSKSTLAKIATVNLDVSVSKEACPLGLAPTASTTVSLVLGDALAIALLETRGFTADDFALSHPLGTLGKRLLLRINDLMHTGNDLPRVTPQASLKEALMEISQKRLGITSVIDETGKLAGVFTDGDLRRILDKNIDIHTTLISEVMSKNCKTVAANALAVEALQIMQTHKITSLVALDETAKPNGIIHMHDLLAAGVV